jgi:uncharacterized RDD family membrane protein YckC
MSSKSLTSVPWRRLGAFIIDYLIIFSVGFILSLTIVLFILIIQGFSYLDIETESERLTKFFTAYEAFFQASIIIIPAIAYWIYSALLESSKWQATIGKRLFGIYVTDEIGNRITFRKASLRAAIKMISGIPQCGRLPIGYLINFGIILLTDKNQGIHDFLAKTYVVEKWTERQAEMPRIFIDQRTYKVAGKNVIVTGDNPAFNNVQLGDNSSLESLANFADELLLLSNKLIEQPASKERDIAIAIITAAEDDARKGDAPKMRG